jgi:Mrp family chromosome partitioning ATPase/capsular polysaccharide biosynthesis protein
VAPGPSSPGALEQPPTSATIHDYLSVLARRKRLVLCALLIVPTVAVGFALAQQPLYKGTSEVLLGHLDLATSLTGIQDSSSALQPERVAQTQASLARVPTVAERTLKASGLPDRTVDDFLKSSSVTTAANSDLLEFSVTDPNRRLASRLASTYAREYTGYRRELDTAAIQRARQDVEKRIDELKARGADRGSLYASLVTNDEKLRTMEALQTSNAFVVRTADTAAKVRPQPMRTAILALALGLVLGVGLAFLVEALDTRVRQIDEIGQRLGLFLLARLPGRVRPQHRYSVVMLENSTGVEAEAFRVLRTNLDLVNREQARTIMITSALEEEGKSETVANLAVAFARSGRRVALVDLDLRRPTIERFFKLSGRHGITDVAVGSVGLDEALVPVLIERGFEGHSIAAVNGNGGRRPGTLEVLPAGTLPDDAGEFVGTHAFGEILRDLSDRVDIVLVDSPALLRVGDGIALSSYVDALLVVVRLNAVRRPILKELRRVLDACPTPKLGFVVTAVEDEEFGYPDYLERETSKNNWRTVARQLAGTASDRS